MKTCIYHPTIAAPARELCPKCYQRIRRTHFRAKVNEIARNWFQANRKKTSSAVGRYHKKRRQIDLAFRLRLVLRNRLWNAVTNKGLKKRGSTLSLLGCDLAGLKSHLEAQFQPEMSWDNYGSVWNIDHETPCAAFNLADPEQQKVCFHFTNLQPLFVEDNLKKGAKVLV